MQISYIRRYIQTAGKFQDAFLLFAQSMYHPGLQFDLPQHRPAKLNSKEFGIWDTAPNNFFNFLSYAYYFLQGSAYKIPNDLKRQTTFIQVLESMHSDEIEMVLDMVQKKMPAKWNRITPMLIDKAIPGILPKNVVEAAAAEAETAKKKEPEKKDEPAKVEPTNESSGDSSTGADELPEVPVKRRRGRPKKVKQEDGSTK